MIFAHIIHIIVGLLLLHLYVDVRRGRLDSRLGVVIGVMAMAPVFWSIGLANGSEANAWAPWIAIGFTCGCYCVRTRHDPGGK